MTPGQDELDEDAFWQIALDHHRGDIQQGDDFDEPIGVSTTKKSYHLPSVGSYSEVTFRLSGLSAPAGMPLGAQAWYGSALLSALLLQPPAHVASALSRTQTALELGSGAVGLSALTLAWVMAHRDNNKNHHQRQRQQSKIILTDHDPLVLKQLQANVSSSRQNLLRQFPDKQFPELDVLALDWNDYKNNHSSLSYSSSSLKVLLGVDNLQLIFGSELVYTSANATACASIVLGLLHDYPQALVIILQVSDREGWNNIFVPTLSKQPGILVQQETVDANVHELASRLIPLGGVLDRFDFEVCYVSASSVLDSISS